MPQVVNRWCFRRAKVMVLQGNVPCGKTVTVGIDSPYRSGCFLRPWVKSMWVKTLRVQSLRSGVRLERRKVDRLERQKVDRLERRKVT